MPRSRSRASADASPRRAPAAARRSRASARFGQSAATVSGPMARVNSSRARAGWPRQCRCTGGEVRHGQLACAERGIGQARGHVMRFRGSPFRRVRIQVARSEDRLPSQRMDEQAVAAQVALHALFDLQERAGRIAVSAAHERRRGPWSDRGQTVVAAAAAIPRPGSACVPPRPHPDDPVRPAPPRAGSQWPRDCSVPVPP